MKRLEKIAALLCAAALLAGCSGLTGTESSEQTEYYTLKYVNQYAYNTMAVYYLWNEEIADGLSSWMSNDDPVEKVKEVRYKDESGKDIDRWTQLTDDYEAFVSSIEGVSTTYGYEFSLFYTSSTKEYVCAVVTLVYEDSPAAKAGLKRSDTILKVDGEAIPTSDYYAIVTGKLMYSSSCTLTLSDGTKVSMDAVEMYCNPVHTWKVFDCGGKKVGYLHFAAFTLKACEDLVTACKELKAQGVSELILDMRYNSGGYVATEEVLASMLVPEANVLAGDVFMRDVYNSILTEAWGDEPSTLKNSFTINGKDLSTADANLGISKIYAILTGGSASASEAIICGMLPYIDIDIIGEQSYGKYCTGVIIEGANWYETYKDALKSADYKNGVKYAANWGLYVMIGRYADCNGETPCMPDGFTPDYEVSDNPRDGYQIGDPEETMLKKALTLAGYEYPAEVSYVKKQPAAISGPAAPKRETFGVLIRR